MLVPILVLSFMAGVVVVMGFGVFALVRGGSFDQKYGNRLMQARVLLQGLAVALILLASILGR